MRWRFAGIGVAAIGFRSNLRAGREIIEALYGSDSSVAVETEITYQDGRTAVTRTELRIETLAEVG